MSKTIKPTSPIVDVARPNESAPSDTSVPVIINNRPILRDPMMAGDLPTVGKPASENSPLSATATKINIQPMNAGETDQVEVKKPEPVEKVDEPISDTPNAEPEQPESPAEVTNGPANPKTAAENIAAEAEAVAKHEAEMQGLADSKKYFLPINTVEKRRTKHFVIIGIGLSLLLVIVWIDIALDAGLIKIGGLKALTHIFST